MEGKGFGISCFAEDTDYNEMSQIFTLTVVFPAFLVFLWYCQIHSNISFHYIYISSSSSSCRSASTDIPDPLSPLLPVLIASGRSSGIHPVSLHSCCMYVLADRPDFAWPYAGVHRSTSLMSSSFLLQQCPACLVRITCIVFVMEGRWPYSWCLVGCCRQDFNISRNIFV